MKHGSSKATGRKYFVLRYRKADGQRARLTLGEFPLLSLSEARTRARSIVVEADQGNDPSQERRDYRVAPTFAGLAEEFMDSPRLAQRSPRTRQEYRRILEHDLLPAWGRKKAVDISRRDIVSLLDRILLRGSEVMALRVRALASVVFSFALEREIVEANPVAAVRKPASERTRDRVLSNGEVKVLWEATESEGPVIRGL